MSSCMCRSCDDLVGDLLAALVARLARLAAASSSSASRSMLDDVAQLLGDVVVDAAEVVALELVAALAAQLLEHLADALEPLAVAVAEPRLHHPPQGGVQVAVVQQVVGDLGEDVVGVELEADLRAVPARVAEATCHDRTLLGLNSRRGVPMSTRWSAVNCRRCGNVPRRLLLLPVLALSLTGLCAHRRAHGEPGRR